MESTKSLLYSFYLIILSLWCVVVIDEFIPAMALPATTSVVGDVG
ncbi:MAG TPA: hypothetical protein VFY83_05200 [Anaerolineales bacterium]|nr:hypothetical protein [Anaerolineales bacterium]